MQCYSVTKGGIDIFIIIETLPSPAGVMLERAKVISEERVQSMINYQQQATVKNVKVHVTRGMVVGCMDGSMPSLDANERAAV